MLLLPCSYFNIAVTKMLLVQTPTFYQLKVFLVIFLASSLTLVPKTPSAALQIIFPELFYLYSTLLNFRLLSFIFIYSWKIPPYVLSSSLEVL